MARPDSALLGNQKGYGRQDCASGSPIRHFVPHPQQSKGSWTDCKNGTTPALRMCLTGNQKVSKWIAIHLQQIDGLQIRHFVPHPAIKRWQSRRKIYGLINIMQITPPIL